MTDKAIEIAKKLQGYVKNYGQLYDENFVADLIRPYLAPEYKYAQVPCSEHISADGFTEAKLRPRKPYAAIGISVGEAKK